ncbi:MAG TPA: fluoride efflux transporter CrcB [Firmicutes bacterium]|nr:fluoride efflux transporter CrcB [Bacillota bacterium]
MSFFFVAFGGALGAMGRYAISLIPTKTEFPVLTLLTNLLGALLIGAITGIVAKNDRISANAILFWKTGVCGGFTTFSTFSLEALALLEKKAYFLGALYIALSVAGCMIGVLCGRKLSVFFR